MSNCFSIEPNLSKYIQEIANNAIKTNGIFRVAIAGGSLPKLIGKLPSPSQVYLVDERLVPLDHEDSNYKLIKETLGVEPLPINANLLHDSKSAAEDYQQRIGNFDLDLILLGAGPDGHIASLFPKHSLLQSTKFIDFITDSPKPPSSRITFTLKAISHAKACALVLAGSSKKEILEHVLLHKNNRELCEIPACLLKNVLIFADKDAVSDSINCCLVNE